MIAAALMALATLQDPPPAAAPRDALYAPPVVRPFEPPEDPARAPAEGDSAPARRRAPPERGVTVEAYGGQYEAEPTGAEIAYGQGVAAAELSMDSRLGPLDGAWRLLDGEGGPLARLVLSDPGRDGFVEGAWRAAAGPGAGGVASRARGAGTVELELRDEGVLSLSRQGDGGWSGVLVDGRGRERPVRLER